MLVFTPTTPQGALGAVLCAVIVVLSLVGLTLHSDFYAGKCRRDYWAYYTNQSNLLVFLYFALLSPLLYTYTALRILIPHAEYALMLCIMLTHIVYHHLLAPFLEEDTPYVLHAPDSRFARMDSAIQHYAVPLLTFFYWLLCSPGKRMLGLADGFIWLAFPCAYAVFVLIRARIRGCIHQTRSAYPYPFLDVSLLGARRVAFACTLMLLGGSMAGLFGVFLVQAATFLWL